MRTEASVVGTSLEAIECGEEDDAFTVKHPEERLSARQDLLVRKRSRRLIQFHHMTSQQKCCNVESIVYMFVLNCIIALLT